MNDFRSIAAQKSALRATMRTKLQELGADDRHGRSNRIVEQIIGASEWQEADNVTLFEPMRSEPDIRQLREFATEAGKQFAVIPRSALSESDVEFAITPTLVFVPGLAFTREGQRLGRGAGFYDRFLTGRGANAVKIGICFEFQIVDSLPSEPHDVVLDAVVTDG